MFKKFSFTLLLLASSYVQTQAAQDPVGFQSDVRIKKFVYDENNVYNLSLYLKSVTAIQFAPDEVVRSILIGDSASWEVVKLQSGNVISIKPIIDAAVTNMTVYTDQRVYTFQLRSVGLMKAGSAAQTFRTIFSYPETADAASAEAAELQEMKYRPSGPVNTDYLVSGRAEFRPVAVADNTLQTVFELPSGSPRPAVFKVGADKRERLINSRTDGRRMIVDGVSSYWVLRIGDETVCVGKAEAVRSRGFIGGRLALPKFPTVHKPKKSASVPARKNIVAHRKGGKP